jgi:hypothetical protein
MPEQATLERKSVAVLAPKVSGAAKVTPRKPVGRGWSWPFGWFTTCVAFAVLVTVLFYAVPHFYPRWERLGHTMLGLLITGCALYCSSLSWVKKLPTSWRKRFQSSITKGHLWVGLLTCWFILIHTGFRLVEGFNVPHFLLLWFYVMLVSGLIAHWFVGMQVLKKEATGSAKKEKAGWLISAGYEVSMFVHEVLHYGFYVLLLLHVLVYFYFGRFV